MGEPFAVPPPTTGATANLGLKEWSPTRYLPKVTVPVALNNGANGPASLANPLSVFCVLYGTHAPFDAAKLSSPYPTHGSYVSQVTKAVNGLVDQRFLLKEDAQTLLTDASHSVFGKQTAAH